MKKRSRKRFSDQLAVQIEVRFIFSTMPYITDAHTRRERERERERERTRVRRNASKFYKMNTGAVDPLTLFGGGPQCAVPIAHRDLD